MAISEKGAATKEKKADENVEKIAVAEIKAEAKKEEKKAEAEVKTEAKKEEKKAEAETNAKLYENAFKIVGKLDKNDGDVSIKFLLLIIQVIYLPID